MRVLAIADEADKRLWDMLDRSLLEGVELVLSAGDLPAEYLSFITCFTHAPVVYVHGNHDTKYETHPPEGCVCAEDRVVNVNGVRVLGLGGSIRYRPGGYMFTEREMDRRIYRARRHISLEGGVDIVLTHAPARGLGDDKDFAHTGFECFLPLMEREKPQFLIHGHVHSAYAGANFQREHQFGATRIINASGRVFFDVEPRGAVRTGLAYRLRKHYLEQKLQKKAR